jgi:transposase
VSVDALGNPLRFTLTGGHRHDITQAETLLDGLTGDYVLADRGYDADAFIDFVIVQGSIPVIPSRKRCK